MITQHYFQKIYQVPPSYYSELNLNNNLNNKLTKYHFLENPLTSYLLKTIQRY